ncbi:MAG: DUF4870 domain-containing protein [Myxococcales bacterium]|nr:MAG: DUF4870 domain-containing protein [Myxococcales bacterium]
MTEQSPYGQPDPSAGTVHNPYSTQQPQQPSLTPAEERNWSVISHVVALAAMIFSAGFLGFVGSLVVYLLYKDRGPFVRQNAANSLNIQIMEFIFIVISVPLMLVLVGFLTAGLAVLFAAVLHVICAIKANNGEWYTPPFTPRFVK